MQLQEQIEQWVNEALQDPGLFLVEVKISADRKRVQVFLDSDTGVTIDDCSRISRFLDEKLDGIEDLKENFTLDVSSAGVEEPLQMKRQYKKNIGRKLAVKLKDGKTVKGTLKFADDERFDLEMKAKKKELTLQSIDYNNVKEARVVINFE